MTAAALGGLVALLLFASAGGVVPPPDAVELTAPNSEAMATSTFPVFEGTGRTDASITVTDLRGTALCTAVVVDARWSCTSSVEMAAGRTAAIASQTAEGVVTSDTKTFWIADRGGHELAFPYLVLTVAAVMGAIAAASLAVRRRVLRRRARRGS